MTEVTLSQLFGGIILFGIITFVLLSLNIRCRLGFHDLSVNTLFCEYSNWGEQTMRCRRCYQDIKKLGWVDMDTGEKDYEPME